MTRSDADSFVTQSSAPDLSNYYWPAEWEPHQATWLAWPRNPETWPGRFTRIPAAFAQFVAAVARFEPVRLIVRPVLLQFAKRLVETACESAASAHPVDFVTMPYNDSWIRDYGPIFMNRKSQTATAAQQPGQLIINWNYNAWGGKYPPWEADAAVAAKVSLRCRVPAVRPNKVLEGGAIDGNGCGTILTTESCLLNSNRNGTVKRATVDGWLQRYLNAQHVVWLPGTGIVGDDTDGHIDQLARFVSDRTVVVATPWSEDAAEAAQLRRNWKALDTATDESGRPLQRIALPMPPPLFEQNHRLPACYCNFYLCNDAVIVPTFDTATDDKALTILQQCFPDRHVTGLAARELVWGLGAFHCLSQQQPACDSD